MILLLILLGVICAILMAGFYAGLETSAYGASGVRLQSLQKNGNERAGFALALLSSLPALITTTLIGHNLSVYLGTFILTSRFEHIGIPHAEFVATIALTPVCFVLAETLPKRLAHMHPNPYILAGARVTRISKLLFTPLGWILGLIARVLENILTRLGYHTTSSTGRERLLEYFEAGLADRVVSDIQHDMVQRILAVQDQSVRTTMIPLAKAVTISEDSTCRAAAEIMLTADHRRAPLVDRAGTPTRRMVTLNDILRNPASLDQPVSQIARDMPSVHANTRINHALRRMRTEHARMAVAVGRNDSPVGFITVSDMLSSVVGAMRL